MNQCLISAIVTIKYSSVTISIQNFLILLAYLPSFQQTNLAINLIKNNNNNNKKKKKIEMLPSYYISHLIIF